jgi:GDP-L-fucose synthase
MELNAKIYIAGHRGLVGSAILRNLEAKGYKNFLLRSINELNLIDQAQTEAFMLKEKPDYVFVAAALVGGIVANNTYRAQFIYENLMVQNNLIHSAYKAGVKKLLFLGSSCIYPKNAPQPMKEEYLLTGLLEPTNEPYAIAKIAGIKMCENYFRQYGSEFISVMPTNLYGPNDNYDLEKSHVLPALIRKMHLGKCLMENDFQAIRQDLARRPIKLIFNEHETGTRDDDSTIKANDTSDPSITDEQMLAVLNKYGIHYPDKGVSNGGNVAVTLWGTGNVYREFLHVDDMADACVHTMNDISANKLYTEMGQTHINIGTGIDLTIRELAETVKQTVSFSGEIIWDHSKPDGTPKKQLDITLLKKLDWSPRISLTDGIRSVYENYTK